MFTTVSNLISRLPELDDGAAWRVFEQRYSHVLKLFFRKSFCAESVSKDLTQETIQRVVQGLKDGRFTRERGRLRDWINGIARNVLRGHLRSVGARPRGDSLRTGFWANQEDPMAESELRQAEERFDAIWVRARLSQLLRMAARNFSPRDLRCYFLVEVRRLPIKLVGERLQLSESAVFQKRRQVANWLLAVAPRFISRWDG
jgi:RNA polymerase sigma factor (sigma-70 family)